MKIIVDSSILEQTLEALEQSETTVRYEGFGLSRRDAERKHQEVIAALRAALTQQQAEPVASLMTHVQSGDVEVVWNDDGFDRELWHETPLYTAPPQRKD